VHQRAYAFEPISSPATLVRDERGTVTSSSQPDDTLPVTLVAHDSFGSWLLPYAAMGSSRMQAYWQHAFPKELIQIAQPDLVVQVYTERVLVWGLSKLAPEIDVVDAARFEAFTPLWKLDPDADGLPGGEGEVRIARAGGGISIEQLSGNGLVAFPAADVPRGAELAVHLDVTAPERTFLTLFYQLAHDRRFTRSRAALVALEPGRNDVRFRLRMPDVTGPIKMRVGTVRGTYVLHALEARSAAGP
jgi:hypothetical protein